MRLIDADAITEIVQLNIRLGNRTVFDVLNAIDDAPTIDAAPVVHGEWIDKLIPTGVSAFGVDEMTCEEQECSVCHKKYWVGEQRNYCPNCGAKMDGERREENDQITY